MKHSITFVGLDVHKDSIDIALGDGHCIYASFPAMPVPSVSPVHGNKSLTKDEKSLWL